MEWTRILYVPVLGTGTWPYFCNHLLYTYSRQPSYLWKSFCISYNLVVSKSLDSFQPLHQRQEIHYPHSYGRCQTSLHPTSLMKDTECHFDGGINITLSGSMLIVSQCQDCCPAGQWATEVCSYELDILYLWLISQFIESTCDSNICCIVVSCIFDKWSW